MLLTLAVVLGCNLVFIQVAETEYVIVKFFGDPHRIIEEPGLAVRWPWPVEDAVRIDKRVKITDVADVFEGSAAQESEYLTRDKKNVLVNFFAVWRVVDPLKFLVSVNDVAGAESRLGDILRSEMGTELGNYDLSDLVSTGELEMPEGSDEAFNADLALRVPPPGETKIPRIMDQITERAAAAAKRDFGIEIVGVRLKRLNFPRQNKQAVFDRMTAERERIAKQYRSEGQEEADKLKAEADRRKEELINTAQRKAEEIRGHADGEATRIYAQAYSHDPEFFEFLQTLQAYEKILKEDDVIVIPDDSPLLRLLKEAR
jgi:membrane protease subunit HflC